MRTQKLFLRIASVAFLMVVFIGTGFSQNRGDQHTENMLISPYELVPTHGGTSPDVTVDPINNFERVIVSAKSNVISVSLNNKVYVPKNKVFTPVDVFLLDLNGRIISHSRLDNFKTDMIHALEDDGDNGVTTFVIKIVQGTNVLTKCISI